MKKIARNTSMIALTSLLSAGVIVSTSHAEVPNTFATGDPILASEMNANFSALDGRLSAVEGSGTQTVNVDCNSDATAFANTTLQDNTTYVLSGMCNGPIQVVRKRNVFIHGDATGIKDDGVVLPANLTENPYAAVAYWESSGELQNLTISASNYVSDGTGYGWPNAGALDGTVSVGQASVLKLYDVDILGGDYGLNVYRSSFAKTYSNVNITGFNLSGVTVSMNSHVQLSESISVIGTSTSTSSDSSAVSVGRNSHIDIGGGGTFTPGVSSSPHYPISLVAYENGTIRVRDSSTATTLNERINATSGGVIRVLGNASITTGGLDASQGGLIRFQNSSVTGLVSATNGGKIRVQSGVILGTVEAYDLSEVRLDTSSQSGGSVYAERGSVIRFEGGTSIDVTGYYIGAGQSANLGFRDTATITSSTPLALNRLATTYIRDGVNFGDIGIACQSYSDQVSIGTNTTIGDTTNCQ